MLILTIKHCGCHNGLHLEQIFLFCAFTAKQLLKKAYYVKKPTKQTNKKIPNTPQKNKTKKGFQKYPNTNKQANKQKEAVTQNLDVNNYRSF